MNNNYEKLIMDRLFNIQQRVLSYLNESENGYTLGTYEQIGDIEFYQSEISFQISYVGLTISVMNGVIDEMTVSDKNNTLYLFMEFSSGLSNWLEDIDTELLKI